MIDGYDWRLRPMPSGEAPINVGSLAEALLPGLFRQWPAPRHELQEWWSLEHGFGSADMETWSHLDGSLFLSSLLLFIRSWRITKESAWVFTTFRVNQMEVELPSGPNAPKGHSAGYWSVVGDMGSDNCVHETVVWLSSIDCLPPYSCTGLHCPWGQHLKREII